MKCKHGNIDCPHCTADWTRYAPKVEQLSDLFEYGRAIRRTISKIEMLYDA